MTNSPVQRIPWKQWAAVTGTGWLVYALLSESVWAVAGFLAIGIGQWLILRRHLEGVRWWFLITPIAILIGGIVGGILAGVLQDAIDGVWSPTFGIRSPSEPGRTQLASAVAVLFVGGWIGATLATAQWRILRKHVTKPWVWLSAHVLGLGLGELLNAVTPRTLLATIAGSIVVGLASSLALLRCLRYSQSGTVVTRRGETRDQTAHV